MLTEIELKEKLIAKINSTDDIDLLMELSMIIEIDEELSEVHQLSTEEIVAVNEGIDQINKGQYLSHEESNKRATEWLRKFDGQ